MAKYDGLIIPRSYNDYVNKSDTIGVLQALQLTGVMDNVPTAQSTKPAKSGGIFAANAVIMADSATLTGVAISAGSVVRVLFTADLTGSDTTTGLTLTYNGNAYAVKVGKDGALVVFVASEISSGVFKYLQAYTTLELMFDGTQFIIIGNPVVLSSSDYTIYADGNKRNSFKYEDLVSPFNSETEKEVSLLHNITDYKLLLFTIRWAESPYIYDTIIFPTGIFRTYNRQVIVENMDGSRARFRYVDDTHIKLRMQNGQNDAYCELFGIVI